jgi:hypothetical protein
MIYLSSHHLHELLPRNVEAADIFLYYFLAFLDTYLCNTEALRQEAMLSYVPLTFVCDLNLALGSLSFLTILYEQKYPALLGIQDKVKVTLWQFPHMAMPDSNCYLPTASTM